MQTSSTVCEEDVQAPAALPFVFKGNDGEDATAQLDLAQAHALVADLLVPNPRTYWIDFLSSALIGWTALGLAIAADVGSVSMYVLGLVAVFALYRALLFNHELVHLRSNSMRGFKFAWGFLAGLPMLLPAILYTGVHADHHRSSTYGTSRDPEYLPFAGARGMIALFMLHSFLLPPLLAVRFLILAPVGLLYPRFHGWLERHASSIAMNPRYCRAMTEEQRAELRRAELCLILFWIAAAGIAISAGIAAKAALVFFCVFEAIALVNSLRTLGAHRYNSSGESLGKHAQILDSIDTPGCALSALWAPVGLRYHALHHFLPAIPYHNLKTAYGRLVHALPQSAGYAQSSSAGLLPSLIALWNGVRKPEGEK